ncbi:hypothetical protein Dimus_021853 [Dionaea muscipula]
MGNHNANRTPFSGNDSNCYTNNDFSEWPSGFSFQQAILQPLRGDESIQQWNSQPRGSAEFVPCCTQGSSALRSRAREDWQYSRPDRVDPLSQSTQSSLPTSKDSNWSIAEDAMLCHVWVRISTDPIVGDS